MKIGDYYGLVGSFEGAFWDGKRWGRFECGGCARQLGLIKHRLQGTMSKGAASAMLGPMEHHHDAETHRLFFANYHNL